MRAHDLFALPYSLSNILERRHIKMLIFEQHNQPGEVFLLWLQYDKLHDLPA